MKNPSLGQRDLLLVIIAIFEKYKIKYLLTGSMAVAYYGFPRATHDIDFVLEISQKDAEKILKAFKNLDNNFQYDKEQIKNAIKDQFQFNIFHNQTGIKIDFWLIGQEEFDKNKFGRAIKIILNKKKINVISAEDLILTKLLWCKEIKSERHLRDCAGIFKIQKGKLDKSYLKLWTKRLGVEDLLKEASAMEYQSTWQFKH